MLEITADEDIEKLIGATEFHVGLDNDRIPPLHDRVLNLMGAHRKSLVDPLAKILTLKHLLEGHTAVEPHDILEAHCLKPFAVEANGGLLRIEDLECLLLVSFRMFQHLLVREMRAGR